MARDEVPQPGPARISKGGGPDEWLAAARQCKYLPEADMKRLCEIVKECLMEGMVTLALVYLQSSRWNSTGGSVRRPPVRLRSRVTEYVREMAICVC
jgi:hypothetical protein